MQDFASEDVEIIRPIRRPAPIGRSDAKGTIRPDDLRIFVPEPVLQEVIEFSGHRTDVEVGGVLVGEFCEDGAGNYVDIEGYIPARHVIQTAASLRFTHDSWSAIHRELDARFPGRIILGWHHTHPNYGIFLSSTDMFTHRNFFNLPWMVALVVDPKRGELGFFQWKQGKVAPCGFYYTRRADRPHGMV